MNRPGWARAWGRATEYCIQMALEHQHQANTLGWLADRAEGRGDQVAAADYRRRAAIALAVADDQTDQAVENARAAAGHARGNR